LSGERERKAEKTTREHFEKTAAFPTTWAAAQSTEADTSVSALSDKHTNGSQWENKKGQDWL